MEWEPPSSTSSSFFACMTRFFQATSLVYITRLIWSYLRCIAVSWSGLMTCQVHNHSHSHPLTSFARNVYRTYFEVSNVTYAKVIGEHSCLSVNGSIRIQACILETNAFFNAYFIEEKDLQSTRCKIMLPGSLKLPDCQMWKQVSKFQTMDANQWTKSSRFGRFVWLLWSCLWWLHQKTGFTKMALVKRSQAVCAHSVVKTYGILVSW